MGLWSNLRYAARSLGRSPTFTAAAVLTLALGIGANIAIFSVVDALLLHPYDFPDLEQIVLVKEQSPFQGNGEDLLAPADFVDFARDSRAYDGIAAFRFEDFNFTGSAGNVAVPGFAVSTKIFTLLGVHAAQGRTFAAEEGQAGHDRVVILGDGIWHSEFAADPRLIGKTVSINSRAYTVVGIMPPKYNYPLGAEMWVPLALSPEDRFERQARQLVVVARLGTGRSLAQARAEAQAISGRLQRAYPSTNADRSFSLPPLRREQFQYTAPLFLTLQAASAFVLLLACVNLTSVLLARVTGRQQEIAIRAALGADRPQLLGVILGETMLVSLLAGALATSLSVWTVELIRSWVPLEITHWVAGWDAIRVDLIVLAFALLLAVLIGVAFGLGTAFQAFRVNVSETLKKGGGRAGGSTRRTRLRGALAIAQVGLAFVLLVGAGLVSKGFAHLIDVYRGFEPVGVVTAEVQLPDTRYGSAPAVSTFYERLLLESSALPGTATVGLIHNLPAGNIENMRIAFTIEGRPAPSPSQRPTADMQSVGGDYFHLLHIPVLNGRAVSNQDGRDAPRVAVISQSMAEKFWPREDPLGRRLKLASADAGQPDVTVVGVVGDVKHNWYDPQPRPTIYFPYLQAPARRMCLLVRTSMEPVTANAALRQLVQRLDREVALSNPKTMERVIADTMVPVRLIGMLMLIFGLLALALSGVGVYGVLAQGVAQRTHEFGLRMAVGARPRDVLRLVLGHALRLSVIGLGLGLPVSFALSRVMRSQLFGLVDLNLALYGEFAALLLFFALLAGFIPAWRAMRLDPVIALRHE